VNANGVISFVHPFGDSVTHPLPLTGDSNRLIAPYWADADIRGTGDIYYRQTSDYNLLARATEQITTAFPGLQDVSVDNLLIATWDRVGYYPKGTDKVTIDINVTALYATFSKSLSKQVDLMNYY